MFVMAATYCDFTKCKAKFRVDSETCRPTAAQKVTNSSAPRMGAPYCCTTFWTPFFFFLLRSRRICVVSQVQSASVSQRRRAMIVRQRCSSGGGGGEGLA